MLNRGRHCWEVVPDFVPSICIDDSRYVHMYIYIYTHERFLCLRVCPKNLADRILWEGGVDT